MTASSLTNVDSDSQDQPAFFQAFKSLSIGFTEKYPFIKPCSMTNPHDPFI